MKGMSEVTVLVVEDESIVAMDLVRRLRKLGYRIAGTAADGETAMKIIAAETPDVILMDIHIKGSRDGIEVAQSVSERYHIPVIFLTAYSEDVTLERAKSAKPYGYLLKPYSERDLHASVQMAIERNSFDLKIQKSETHLKLALDAASLATWEMDDSRTVILGYRAKGELDALENWQAIHDAILPADKARVDEQLNRLQTQPDAEIEVEFEVENPQCGRCRWLLYGKRFGDPKTGNQQVVGVIQDITERRKMEAQLQQAAMVYRCSADGIVILDETRQVVSTNQAFVSITGFDTQSVLNEELVFLKLETLGKSRYEELWRALGTKGNWQEKVCAYRYDGTLMHAWFNIACVPDGAEAGGKYVVILSDITAVHEAQEKLSYIAYYDSLTKLPNRNLFKDRLNQSLAKAERENHQLALLFIDLDHFKRINDTLGHQIGDLMLKSVAQRLKSAIRASDTLCRLGGDEFIVIMEAVHARDDIAMLARKLLKALNQPMKLGAVDVLPSGSIGIAVFPGDAADVDDLIKMADTAMYSAKHKGRNRYSYYLPEMTEQTAQYLQRERELRNALNRDEFLLYYQPQFDAKTHEIVGLEALVRWQNPQRGLLSAAEIIPFAETNSLIIDIGKCVIEKACQQIKNWLDRGFQPPRVAINVSVRQLKESEFVSQVKGILEQYQIKPGYLELEITESCLQDNELATLCLKELEQLGLHISIDDFGTGYSCLASLKIQPIHKLKIDQAFIRDIPADEDDCAIVSAIIAMAKQLKLKVIAEGVETTQQAEFISRTSCDQIQGFFMAKPMSAEDIAACYLTTSRRA
jgi:diguanylate cyclase (GGDEF)-like protein/PAS domain S-box-containing protein